MKIYSYFPNGIHSKEETITLLIAYIKNDSKSYNRIGSVDALKLLEFNDKYILNFCENLAISDEVTEVRYKAINLLIESFRKKNLLKIILKLIF